MKAQKGYVFRVGSSWFLRYRDNFMSNGKIVRRQKCVFLAKKSDRYRRESDLTDLIKEKMDSVRAADKCPTSADSFVDYVEKTYLPFVQRKMKPSTYAGYRSYWIRYIKPRVQPYALRDFNIAIVSRLLADVASMHKINVDTAGKIRSVLSAIFSFALSRGEFPGRSALDNPAHSAAIPEQASAPKETVAATFEQVSAILAHLAEQKLTLARAAVALIAYTGVRPGECRGIRWEDYDRAKSQIRIQRSIWHAVEGTTKTVQSNRFVAVTDELRPVLSDLWKAQGSPLGGYMLGRANGDRINLDNESKRVIAPALKEAEIPWHGWYSLRRFHGTVVREEAGNSDTMSKALGNSKAVADKHYLKNREVLPDVRKAVNGAMAGLIN